MMKNTTFSIKGISAGDLNSTLDILEKIVNTTGPDIEKEVIQLTKTVSKKSFCFSHYIAFNYSDDLIKNKTKV